MADSAVDSRKTTKPQTVINHILFTAFSKLPFPLSVLLLVSLMSASSNGWSWRSHGFCSLLRTDNPLSWEWSLLSHLTSVSRFNLPENSAQTIHCLPTDKNSSNSDSILRTPQIWDFFPKASWCFMFSVPEQPHIHQLMLESQHEDQQYDKLDVYQHHAFQWELHFQNENWQDLTSAMTWKMNNSIIVLRGIMRRMLLGKNHFTLWLLSE